MSAAGHTSAAGRPAPKPAAMLLHIPTLMLALLLGFLLLTLALYLGIQRFRGVTLVPKPAR